MAAAVAVQAYQPGMEVEVKHGKLWLPAQVLQSTPTADGDELDAWVEVHFEGWDSKQDRFERASAGRLRLKGGDQQWSMLSAPPPRQAAAAGVPTTPEKQTEWQRQRRSSAAAPLVSPEPEPEPEQRPGVSSPAAKGLPRTSAASGGLLVEQRAELLKRGRGLARLERMPAAVLAGGLAPPMSGAWHRRTVSKAASRYNDLDRQPLFVSPTKSPPGSSSRPNSRSMAARPRTAEGGSPTGNYTSSLRLLVIPRPFLTDCLCLQARVCGRCVRSIQWKNLSSSRQRMRAKHAERSRNQQRQHHPAAQPQPQPQEERPTAQAARRQREHPLAGLIRPAPMERPVLMILREGRTMFRYL